MVTAIVFENQKQQQFMNEIATSSQTLDPFASLLQELFMLCMKSVTLYFVENVRMSFVCAGTVKHGGRSGSFYRGWSPACGYHNSHCDSCST